ncbi:MAG: hypothetical protein QY321_04220 [Patescibacteria group bacterium]|nr:MAG: hypothetical protein QY321_04220 [Patescibacteria group bacterium]
MFYKKFISLLLALFIFVSPVFVLAQEEEENNEPSQTQQSFGFGDRLSTVASVYSPENSASIEDRIGSIIAVILSLLGILFLILMLYGGYNWMTAAGDEEKVKKAGSTIRSAVIGLIIVIASYAVSVFVVARIWSSSGG